MLADEQKVAVAHSSDALVEMRQLSMYFPVKTGGMWLEKHSLKAVECVDAKIAKGEVFGLVGESGCGKSTLGRLVLRLLKPTAGEVFFDGTDITHLSEAALRPLRRRLQVVFQDPFASLNPRMTVGTILGEVLSIHNVGNRKDRTDRIVDLLETVGLHAEAINKYPHEFSGGQRQRVGIARALAVRPEFIVLDEPVSALDVSIQAQIINLLRDLRDRFNLTYLFISHDLDLVEFLCDRVAIMYLGRIMEVLPARNLHEKAKHPYSKALISAVPKTNPGQKTKKIVLPGDVPSAIDPPAGCVFHTRCPLAKESCKESVPTLRATGAEHWLACDIL